MRIALAYYGVVRPPSARFSQDDFSQYDAGAVSWCSENVEMLKSCFKNKTIDTYLFSWNCKNSQEFSKIFDTSILMKKLENSEAEIIIKKRPSSDSQRFSATYGEFFGPRSLINLISNTEIKYDYIIFSRPDVRFQLDESHWINDHYNGNGGIRTDGSEALGGFIGAAPADIMKRIFSITIEDYRNILANSKHSEEAWQKLLDFSGVKWHGHDNGITLMQFRQSLLPVSGNIVIKDFKGLNENS